MTSEAASRAVTLRRATVEDAARLANLARHLFSQTFGPANTLEDMQLYLASAFSTEKQSAELSDPQRAVWIAECAGAPVGYVALRRDTPFDHIDAVHPAEIERIYADAAYHGAGVGARLMEQCVEQARAWMSDLIWLAVWEKNPRAIAFYRKSGFEPAGAKTFMLGTDPQRDVVMARKL